MRHLTILLSTLVLSLVDSEEPGSMPKSANRSKPAKAKWWNLANSLAHYSNLVTPDLSLYINPSLQPLSKKQRRLISKNPGTIVAVAKGATIALEECKYQFQDRRWNCPTVDDSHGGSIFGNILEKGCRETSFIYAITSAAVTHSVARSCSEGSVYTCTCGNKQNTITSTSTSTPLPISMTSEDWEWGGCSDNIKFGRRFSRDFVDSLEKGRDLKCMTNLHNNDAGRKHVATTMKQECKCHGMSGSCTLRTCWLRLRHFRIVGNALKDRFDGASKVYQSNNGNTSKRKKRGPHGLIPMNLNHRPPRRRDLVYYEQSPDFCSDAQALNYMSTSGRECNATSLGVDGCDLMCCGMGHTSEKYIARERCFCTFHWCCEVTCQICTKTKTRHRCR